MHTAETERPPRDGRPLEISSGRTIDPQDTPQVRGSSARLTDPLEGARLIVEKRDPAFAAAVADEIRRIIGDPHVAELERQVERLTAERNLFRDAAPTRSIWRVTWWRPGWARGKDGLNIRLFQRESAARDFVAKLTSGDYVTPAGPAEAELSECRATAWEAVR